MPKEAGKDERTYQINFRYSIPAQTRTELHYKMKEPNQLIDGFFHFPPGCNALVRVRLLLGKSDIGMEQITPIDDQYIALDASDYPFSLGQTIDREDFVILEIINNDTVNAHTITCIVSKRRIPIYTPTIKRRY